MITDPTAPVIVGAHAFQQQVDDPSRAMDAMHLVRAAVEGAAADAGSASLLAAANVVMLPHGTWNDPDPATAVLPESPHVRTIIAEIGVLQQTLLSRATTMVAGGEADVVVVCGGEDKYRALRATITGATIASPGPPPPATQPGSTTAERVERMTPAHEVITRWEIERGLPVPARQYALIDTALRRVEGLTPAQHIEQLAALQSRFSAIAADNPGAWNRAAVDEQTIRDAPMLSFPYTKLHCSQWNVNQAAAVIVCSVDTAERFGVARDRWVFAHLGVESNLMVPVTERAEIHRSPAMAVVGATIADRLGATVADMAHLDLYSCFPAAVRVQVRELGIDPTRQLTLTGGMTFAGGPLNNYTLQALVKLVQVLRDDPASSGVVTNVSGMLTKYGASVWSCTPPDRAFTAVDVSAEAEAATSVVRVDPAHVGPADVVTYTVVVDKGTPSLGIAVGRTTVGTHTLATTTDQATMLDMLSAEFCARTIFVDGAAFTA